MAMDTGVNTTVTTNTSKHFRQASHAPGNSKQKFDFSKLVNSIMTNPFTSSGLNAQTQLFTKGGSSTLRAGGRSLANKCRPCKESTERFRKTSNIRYK